jgi:hypothetical protein
MVRFEFPRFRLEDILKPGKSGMEIVLSAVATYLILKSGRSFVGKKLTLGYMACMLSLTTIWYIAGACLTADSLEGDDLEELECSAVALTTKATAMIQILGSDVLLVRENSHDACPLQYLNIEIGISHVHYMGEGLACDYCTRRALHNNCR